MSNWIKASEKEPEVGRLVVVRSPSYEPGVFYYDAGHVKEKPDSVYIQDVRHDLPHWIMPDSEWQYVEE